MKDRNELPEGWNTQPGVMGDNYLYRPQGIVAFFRSRAEAIAAAWRIVDAEAAKEPKS